MFRYRVLIISIIVFIFTGLVALLFLAINNTEDNGVKFALSLSTGFSILSLLGSLFSIYKDNLKPFCVTAFVNTKIVLQAAIFQHENVNYDVPLISVGFVFYSEGSKTVYLEFLKLRVENKTTGEVKWFHVANELESINGGDLDYAKKNTKEEIGALVLEQGFQQIRKFAFVEVSDVSLLTGVSDYDKMWKKFNAGSYQADLYMGRIGDKRLFKISNFGFSLSKDLNVPKERADLYTDSFLSHIKS